MINIGNQFQKRISDSIDRINKSSAADQFKLAQQDLGRIEDQGIQAGIMSNWDKVTDSADGRAFMTTNNFGPYLPELWPIITAWYPEFPLKELVSVQDMEQALAYIITSELLTGTNKADTFSGEKVETPSGPRVIKGRYPTGEIFGELLEGDALVLETTDTVSALAYAPLMGDQDGVENTLVEIYNSSDVLVKTLTAGTVSGGKIALLDGAVAAGNIELQTGIITLTGVDYTTYKVSVSYVWNIETANDDNIPTIVEDMKMTPITAKPQVLAMKWTIFSEFVKKKQFGIDIRTQTTKRVLDLLYQYQVRYILDKMWNGATGGNNETITWDTTIVDLYGRIQNLLSQLNTVSNIVMENTGRVEGNRLVVGSNAKALFESLPDNIFKPEVAKDYGFNGPRKIGTIGRFTVFYDDKLASDAGFMTYRGSEWYDAAAYFGVFMPIAPTDLVNVNINLRQAFVTMTAFRLDKPNAVVRLTFA